MRSLLWSEWRSKRLWGLALASSVIVPILLGDPLTFWGSWAVAHAQDTPEVWFYMSEALLPCMVIALLFGAMAFAGELGSGTQDFLMSRPVSWKKLLAAKLVVGIGMLAGTGVAAAIVFRLMCPAPYLPFLPFSQIAAGFVGIGLAMTMPYLFGAACSVVLPGVVGSLLTMLVIAVLTGLDVALTLMLFGYGPDWVVVSALSWTGGAIVAALVIVRFGFTLSVAQRIRRYAFVMLGCVVCLTAAVLAAHRPTSWILTDYAYSFSPDLSNAIVLTQVRTYSIPRHMAQTQLIGFQSHSYFWRTTDGAKRDWPSGADLTSPSEWLNNDTYFDIRTCIWEHRRWVRPTLLTTVRLGKSGKLEITRIPMGYDVYVGSSHFISPDGKIAAFIAPRNPHTPGDERRYRFFDIEQRKWLETTVPCASYRRGWWQNDREYAWLDNKDNLHTTQVR